MSQSSSMVWIVAIFLLASQHMYASDVQSKVSSDKINSDIQVSGPSESSKKGIQDVISPANSKSGINTPTPKGKVVPGTNIAVPAKNVPPTSKGSATSTSGTKPPVAGNGVKAQPPAEHKPQGTKTPVANSSGAKIPSVKSPAITKAPATSGNGVKSSAPEAGGSKPQTPTAHKPQGKKTQAPTGRHRPDAKKPTRRGHDTRRQGGSRYANQRRAATPLRENCSVFSPNHLAIVRSRGHWAVVDRAPLLHFSHRRSARRAITVLKHYRMSKQCTVGYPKTIFRYYLANSAAPVGYRLRGEHCVSFSPVLLRLVRTRRGRWVLAEGRRYLFRFRYNRRDAIKALNVIQKYTFNHSCYVGHGRHVMRYLLQR